MSSKRQKCYNWKTNPGTYSEVLWTVEESTYAVEFGWLHGPAWTVVEWRLPLGMWQHPYISDYFNTFPLSGWVSGHPLPTEVLFKRCAFRFIWTRESLSSSFKFKMYCSQAGYQDTPYLQKSYSKGVRSVSSELVKVFQVHSSLKCTVVSRILSATVLWICGSLWSLLN